MGAGIPAHFRLSTANVPGKGMVMLESWSPVTHMGEPDGGLGFWLWPEPSLSHGAHLGSDPADRQMISLSPFSLASSHPFITLTFK